MPLESVICRKKLDESRGRESICECPLCREEKRGKEASDKEAEEIGSIEEKRAG
jgi:hypothetical protein